MNPADRMAVDPEVIDALSNRWRQQALDLHAAAASLAAAPTGLPVAIVAGVQSFLVQWSDELAARAVEAGEISLGLNSVAASTIAADHQWAVQDAWGAAG